MADVIATVRSALGDEVVQRLAGAFGEDAGALRRGLDAAVPGVLGSLTAKSRTDEGAAEVAASLRDAQVGPSLLVEFPKRLDGVKLQGRASGLGLRALGERGRTLAEQLSTHAGLKPSTASSLLDLAVPLVLAGIAKSAAAAAGDAGRLRTFLVGQEASVRRAMPAEFEAFVGASVGVGVAATAGVAASAGRSRLWWLLGLVLLLAVVLLLLFRAFSHPAAVTHTEAPRTTLVTTTIVAPALPAANDNIAGQTRDPPGSTTPRLVPPAWAQPPASPESPHRTGP